MKTVSASTLLLICALAFTGARAAQQSIPEILAEKGKSITKEVTAPSGFPPTSDQLLVDTDLIVRGVLVGGRSYLSPDEHEIYTDYEIKNPRVLYDSRSQAPTVPTVPTGSLNVTIIGGEIVLNGLRFKSVHDALPSLNRGQEHLLLLKREGEHYFIAAKYFGAFRVSNGFIEPAAHHEELAKSFSGRPADEIADGLVMAAARLHKRSR